MLPKLEKNNTITIRGVDVKYRNLTVAELMQLGENEQTASTTEKMQYKTDLICNLTELSKEDVNSLDIAEFSDIMAVLLNPDKKK